MKGFQMNSMASSPGSLPMSIYKPFRRTTRRPGQAGEMRVWAYGEGDDAVLGGGQGGGGDA